MKTFQNEMFDRFDEMFDNVYENISNGWRSFSVDDFHVAVVVYQRILLECMDDDSLNATKKLRQVKQWVLGCIGSE